MDISVLAAATAAAISPLLVKGAEKFVEESGKDAYSKTNKLGSVDRLHRLPGCDKIVNMQDRKQSPTFVKTYDLLQLI